MPVLLRTPVRRLSQAKFGDLAYSVMQCVFGIHRDMGRFFDEKIYKRELAHRHAGVQLEVPIEVVHASFRKLQYLDVLVDSGGPFEFKAVETFTPRHPAQLLHYLFLTELDHGKLVNLRTEQVEHQFVNTTLRHDDRIRFAIADSNWSDRIPGAERFREALIRLLRDLGTGLDSQLYEEALSHLLGGEAQAVASIEVRTPEYTLGHQKLRLASSRAAFFLSTRPEACAEYESHAWRLLRHTDLEAIFWANISLKTVTLTTIRQNYLGQNDVKARK